MTDKPKLPFKVEVKAGGGDDWAGNALTFETRAEAEHYAIDLAMRWTSVREYRVVKT